MLTATVKLEAIGDGIEDLADSFDRFSKDLGFDVQGKGRKPRYWVARIAGTDARYGFRRQFMRGHKDYSEANSVGTRGVFVFYMLGLGLYEIKEPLSWRSSRQYFALVDEEGVLTEVHEERAREIAERLDEEERWSEEI